MPVAAEAKLWNASWVSGWLMSPRKARAYSIEVEDLTGTTPIDKRCYFLKIPAGRTQSTSYRHTFARRGLYRFLDESSRFPMSGKRLALLLIDMQRDFLEPGGFGGVGVKLAIFCRQRGQRRGAGA